MVFRAVRFSTVLAIAAGLTLASCANTPKPSRGSANALLPESVHHQGSLTPVNGVANTVTGNTMVLVQPWVGRTRYELRETPVYFRTDGYADSPNWADIPWSVQGSEICMASGSVHSCYDAYQDSSRQAYVMDRGTGLLAKVKSIEPGDPYHVHVTYEARKQQEAAQQAVMMAFAGLLFEAMVNGGGGGGGDGGIDTADAAYQSQQNIQRWKNEGLINAP